MVGSNDYTMILETYRQTGDKNSIDFDNIGIVELSHDGCLL